MRWQSCLFPLLAGVLLPGCAGKRSAETQAGASPFGPTGIPPQLRKGGNKEGSAVTPGGNQEAAIAKAVNYSPSDLAWTNPDDPDAAIPELENVMAGAATGTRWIESEATALRESKTSGKPLLIWFTDKNISACKTLNDELISTPPFEQWATDHTVRLVVDMQPVGKNPDDVNRKTFYAQDLKKKYNVSGFPNLVVIAPSGEVIGRYKSYRKGKEDFIWGQLKQGVSIAAEKQRAWKELLEKKGYRDWSNGRGRVIFAKLTYYNDGEMVLSEPDGLKARTHEKHLSAGDRVWIQQQKEARGIQ